MFERALTKERIEAYPKIILGAFALVMAVWIALSAPTLIDPAGKPIGYDFMAFWSAGRLAVDGRAADVHDVRAIFEAHQLGAPHVETFYLWHYPPTFLLTVTPLGAMPYLVAFALFMGLSLWAWARVVRGVITDRRALWAAAALPASLMCVFHGQNSLLVAALFGGALLLLDKRPLLAGVLIGLLAIKPHLAILFPIALAASGRWRTFAAAAATLILFVLATIPAFGVEAWRAFFANLPHVRALVDEGFIPWRLMPTLYVFARSLAIPPELALIVQITGAAIAALLVWSGWRRADTPFPVQAALLASASMLVSPYLFIYDMPLVGLAVGWLAMHGLKTGFAPGERTWLALAWATPLLALPIFAATHVQPGVIAIFAVMLIAARRIAPATQANMFNQLRAAFRARAQRAE
jgi:hypothetical protein